MAAIPNQNIFSANAVTSKRKKSAPLTSVLSSAVTVPILPDSTPETVRTKFLMGLLAAGTSTDDTIGAWKVYIMAYTFMLFPSLKSTLGPNLINLTTLSSEAISGFIQRYDAMVAQEEIEEKDDITEEEKVFCRNPVLPGCPVPNAEKKFRYLDIENHYKIIAGHYSLVLFLAGKRIEGDDHSPLTVNRPRAVLGKIHQEGPVQVLDGELRLSDKSHNAINSAWAELSGFRVACLKAFADFDSDDASEINDIIYTSMHLLKHNGMQHAKISFNFINAYPWVHEIPALKTSLSIFADSVLQAATYDESIRPYVKLMYGDKANIFPRKDLEPLVACAVTDALDTNASMARFYKSSDYNAIVEMFIEERDRRGNIRQLKIQKEERELLDDDLDLLTPEGTTE